MLLLIYHTSKSLKKNDNTSKLFIDIDMNLGDNLEVTEPNFDNRSCF